MTQENIQARLDEALAEKTGLESVVAAQAETIAELRGAPVAAQATVAFGEIKLPDLPPYPLPGEGMAWTDREGMAINRYARAAIRLDRQQRGEPVGIFNGKFGGDVNGNMWFTVKAYDAIPEVGANIYTAPQPPTSAHQQFQARVQPWMMECFGPAISGDRKERNHRFLEESLELVQANGCTACEAHQLVDYTFGRPLGEPCQEVGGVMVTLAALCLANDLSMHAAGETELARVWTKVDEIRAKQAAKPKHSPLPVATQQPVAWMHIMHMELEQETVRFSENPDESPFGKPGRDHSAEYRVDVIPLFTAPQPSTSTQPAKQEQAEQSSPSGSSEKMTLAEAKSLLGLPDLVHRLNLGDGKTAIGSGNSIEAVKKLATEPNIPTSWTLTYPQIKALATELVKAAETMGSEAHDPEYEGEELVLEVRQPGTVSNDDGSLNERTLLAVSLFDYPEEGVYPIDPAECAAPTLPADGQTNDWIPDNERRPVNGEHVEVRARAVRQGGKLSTLWIVGPTAITHWRPLQFKQAKQEKIHD